MNRFASSITLIFLVGRRLQPAVTPEPVATVVPRLTNELPLPVGGQVLYFNETTQGKMRDAGMTWVKWQVPFIIGDDNLLNVARDRINWSHDAGFNVLLNITGEKENSVKLTPSITRSTPNGQGRLDGTECHRGVERDEPRP